MATVKETIATLPSLFNPKKAKGYTRIIQLDISGEGGGQWYLDVKNQELRVVEGKAEKPRFVMTVSDEAFVKYFSGAEPVMSLVRSGQLKFTGPMTEGIAFSSLWIIPKK
ncbi:MAG: SCP2 sterol-binding domain-containing protein [Spirochaetes bacterium]|nr:SCP2 sterol-binding domain-containing protein [Spirochaetota bacterium]MBU1078848.1 SCP2 sterol-binding domain-containing protein [Spirochaetota bacterium]